MSAQTPSSILLVDDDQFSRQILAGLFRAADYQTLEASTAVEALELARSRHPDLIVLDVNLPDMDGFAVCRLLKENPDTRDVSVLHLSAVYVGTEDRSHGLEEGADGYLVKPVEPREILATVRALLRVRAAEAATRAAAAEWRATFDAISDLVCLLSPEGAVLRCNRAFRDLAGGSYRKVLGQPFGLALQQGLGLERRPELEVLGRPGACEPREVALGRRWFRHKADPMFDERGAWSASVHILTDVTHEKDLEEQVRQGQKLEASARLAGGIAHDFNNLLTAILGNASLLIRNLPGEMPEAALAGLIERAAWRAADLTRQLLGFSRQTLLWLKAANLNDAVNEVASNLRRTLPATVTLEVKKADDLAAVQADPMQIAQVLANLCVNSLDAMPAGGVLMLESSNAQVSERQAQENSEARAGPFVRLRVADTGEGIAPEVLPRVFDPFFTTKPVGKGTGLGLAMVYGIVKQHQGWVECHSKPGAGTTFDVYLPRSDVAGETATLGRRVGGGSETILLAGDNDVLRELTATLLRQNGFEVRTVPDGLAALREYGDRKGQIDLVILDLTLPPLTGAEAAQGLRRLDPGVRVLLISAEGNSGEAELVRPYREVDLVQAVRSALRASERRNKNLPG